jgi:hypothetical protein
MPVTLGPNEVEDSRTSITINVSTPDNGVFQVSNLATTTPTIKTGDNDTITFTITNNRKTDETGRYVVLVNDAEVGISVPISLATTIAQDFTQIVGSLTEAIDVITVVAVRTIIPSTTPPTP